MAGVAATRMELLAQRRQLALARQGRGLLEEKRAAMLRELIKRIQHVATAIISGEATPEEENVQIHFYATLRPIVGGKTVEIPAAPGITVQGLIGEIIGRYPDLRPQLLDADGQLYRHVHVFVNGRDAPYLDQGLETVLTSDDAVDIFPPVAGGAG